MRSIIFLFSVKIPSLPFVIVDSSIYLSSGFSDGAYLAGKSVSFLDGQCVHMSYNVPTMTRKAKNARTQLKMKTKPVKNAMLYRAMLCCIISVCVLFYSNMLCYVVKSCVMMNCWYVMLYCLGIYYVILSRNMLCYIV